MQGLNNPTYMEAGHLENNGVPFVFYFESSFMAIYKWIIKRFLSRK